MVIRTRGSYISSVFQNLVNFGRKVRKYSPQFNLHLFKAMQDALGQSKSLGMCTKCQVVEPAAASSSLTQEGCWAEDGPREIKSSLFSIQSQATG